MTVVNMTVGGVTDTTATFAVKVTTGPNVRVAVATDAGMTSPTFFGPVAIDANSAAKVSATGLTANTRYWWQVEDNGTLDTDPTGQFVTHPAAAGNVADFTFIASGDAGLSPEFPDTTGSTLAATRQSNHPCFDTIRAADPLFFAHLGDLHYYDLGSGSHGIVGGGSLANYRRSYDDVLLQTRQHQLYREIPLVYVWDDHDYGPNDSDGTLTDKANAAQAYRERVPSYTLAEGSGSIYHSFHVGRVLFVVSDTRYNRSPNTDTDGPSKTMLGATQKIWLDNLLASDTSQALVWLMPTPWMGATGADTWAGFATERTEVTAIVTDNGWADKTLMINADNHINAFAAGASNPHGGWPVVMVGGIDASFTEGAGGQYDVSFPGRDQYATIDVRDRGGSEIAITATLWRGTTAQQWLTFNTTGTTAIPAPGPSHVLAL